MMIIRGVNVFPSEIEHYLLQIEELAPIYQVHLLNDGVLDSVELHVEMDEVMYQKSNGVDLEGYTLGLMKKSSIP